VIRKPLLGIITAPLRVILIAMSSSLLGKRGKVIIFLLIVAAAIFFRTYKISEFPPGLYPDEAVYANDALQAWETKDFKVFYPNNNGREGLYINILAVVFGLFGASLVTVKIITILSGVIGVIALYLLAKELFNWQIGAIAGWLYAISFWPVNFSRIGFRATLAPTLMILAIYFLVKGLRGKHFWNFAFSGIMLGLGMYTYIAFRVAPAVFFLTLVAYLWFVKKDYLVGKYKEARLYLARGVVLIMLSAIIVAIPLGFYYLNNPQDFFGRTAQISIFSGDQPWLTLSENTFRTLGMFNFSGDGNWRHNIAGAPLLVWPIGILFLLGFIRAWFKLVKHKKDHGHFSVVQTLLLSWFFLGLLPVVFSSEGIPHALRALLVMPPVFIWAAEGCWWLYCELTRYHAQAHPYPHRALLANTLVLLFFLAAMGALEYNRYFHTWGKNPNTYYAFNGNYVAIGQEINALPVDTPKYVLVKAGGTLVNGIPMPAQTVMFVTNTFTKEKQTAKNVHYLLPGEETSVRDPRAHWFILD